VAVPALKYLVVRVAFPRFGDVALVAVATAFEIGAHERPLVGLSLSDGCAVGTPALLAVGAVGGGCCFRVTLCLRHDWGTRGCSRVLLSYHAGAERATEYVVVSWPFSCRPQHDICGWFWR